jgi:hypothetical protein
MTVSVSLWGVSVQVSGGYVVMSIVSCSCYNDVVCQSAWCLLSQSRVQLACQMIAAAFISKFNCVGDHDVMYPMMTLRVYTVIIAVALLDNLL